MKLPENPTKNVRNILAIQIQCPGARLTDTELYKIKELCDCLDTTISTLLLSESQNYCKICGNTLDGYVPPKEKK